ncbi:purple acid phosphatase 14 [Rhynchospora pubera]|uniref:Purple acid phosphatase 14 n=1 Tax=Rhynchospora pubera TaxID=906938 RepID=A0AAV8EZA1_9POAL|nr:purple acid phosphatase 14 [Rhynchospora pubera]
MGLRFDDKTSHLLRPQHPTDFLYRVIRAENPDLVVFTGDNIYGKDTTDPVKSMNMAFDPVVALKLPFAAVLGNHDQESSLSREDVMRHITTMPYSLSRLNPDDGSEIDGYGNYNIEISGPEGSPLVNKSVLNLYFLDSGDYSTVQSINGYSWIKLSQQVWFQKTSSQLQLHIILHFFFVPMLL